MTNISSNAAGAREAARQGNGKFGHQVHGEAESVVLGAPAPVPAEAYDAAARAVFVETNWHREIQEHYSNQLPEVEYRAKAAARWDGGGAGFSNYQKYPRESAAAVEAAAPFLASRDQFAHLTGLEKAKAQSVHAAELGAEAAALYAPHLRDSIAAEHPSADRLYVSKDTDPEYGITYKLSQVEDLDGNILRMDLEPLADHQFLDQHLEPQVDWEETGDRYYIDLNTGV